MNPMENVVISKTTLNIGVGESGERLSRAISLLTDLTGQKPVKTFSKVTNPEFGIRKRQPIACKVTLRGEKADDAIKLVLDGIGNNINKSQFDDQGNLSFGIAEHIDMPGIKYDPDIGIFGINVNITFEKLGYRIKRRKIRKSKIPTRHMVKKDQTIRYMEDNFKVSIE
ncbi:MAG: 50S ribosomal protein L5 [Methanobrevibacter sp.]|jgi:large subunit ribosomal protein L5|nr:50S ribosomal protein L5 [Candidatus Methanovirga aequatorialis]